MTDFTLQSMASFLLELAVHMPMAEQGALAQAADLIETEAKAVIGEYQDGAGPFGHWDSLQQETIERKANGDTPLLETGEMRASIGTVILDHEAHVGSNDDKAVWQELGTVNIPPRSFLGLAAVRKSEEVKEIVGRTMHASLIKPETAFANGARRAIDIP